MMSRPPSLFDVWANSMQLGLVTLEAPAVIGIRFWGLTGFWSITDAEKTRMFSEKSSALTSAVMNASWAAMTRHAPEKVIAAAIKPLRQKTRANARRLAKRGPKPR